MKEKKAKNSKKRLLVIILTPSEDKGEDSEDKLAELKFKNKH